MQRMKSLSESQRELELERKLFSAVRALKQSQSDNIKLQVEEFKFKYEPDEVNKKYYSEAQVRETPCRHLYPKPNPALPGDSKCVRICEEPPNAIPNRPMSVSPWSCRPLSLLLRGVNFGFLVVFFLGFVRALTTRPPLPTLPLSFGRAVTGKSLH
ncbi:hypothetical protein J4Q44_G00313080 [Coregonus suidteri]|uniref:Uncharacterized protein n=1 Tax=Coregonus suidteri TaxID=861788 RepID=A0AAN8KUH7_9TELE